jgi:hypothetical protein
LKRRARRERREIFGKRSAISASSAFEIVSGGLGFLGVLHAGSGARGGSRGRGARLKRRARRERREIFGKTLGHLSVEIVSGGLGPHRARCRLWSARGKQRARSPFETPSAQRTPRNFREDPRRSRRARRLKSSLPPAPGAGSGARGGSRGRGARFETPSAQRTPRNVRENAPRSRRARRLKSSLAASAPTAPGAGSGARGGKQRTRSPFETPSAQRTPRNFWEAPSAISAISAFEIVSSPPRPVPALERAGETEGAEPV